MALTFPSSPIDGQVFTDTETGNRYLYDATRGLWKFAANNVGMTVSSIPPVAPAQGAMWYHRDIGRTFVYYDDGDSKQWVEVVPAPGSFDSATVAGFANAAAQIYVIPVYTNANAAFRHANAGFTRANTALQNTSGTFAGDLSITGNVGIGTNFSSKFFEIRKDQNSETSLWITNNNSIAPGTNNSIIFGGYRDVEFNYQVAKISAIHGTGSSANLNHSGALAFFTQQASGLLNPDLPIERMRIDSSGRVTKPYQPAFRVTTTDNGSFTTGTIPWNTSIFNNGGHFSTSTYRFTAPVAGFYFFEAHTLSNRNTNTGDHGFDFFVNGSAVKRIYSGISGSASVHSEARGFVLLQLNVNDYVTTEMYGNAKTGIVGTPNHDQFVGYFLG
jgi:hypothetical protein